MAIADEPTVFWDGADADALVEAWKQRVQFQTGDDSTEWGHVRAVGNGTSGRSVRDGVLQYLDVDVADTWFTDAMDVFFVKRGGSKSRQQGNVIDAVYAPFAERIGLSAASLPPRPLAARLVESAVEQHTDRLRAEFTEANAPLIVTLGEEARQVLARIADHVDGPPTSVLSRSSEIERAYGNPGRAIVGDVEGVWLALAHPGNRDPYWSNLHNNWQRRLRPDLMSRPNK